MPVTGSQLKALSPMLDEDRLAEELAALADTLDRFEINTLNRVRFFLAQVLHESGSLLYTQEIWVPTAAQRRYEWRPDIGNTIAGDGYRFRGRGYIQLTGRRNYFNAGLALGESFVKDPDLVAQLPWRWIVSGWFWQNRGLNRISDAGTDVAFKKVTKLINGGYTHMERRRARLKRACVVIKSL